MSDRKITAHTTSDYKLNPELSCFGIKKRVEFNGSYLKQNKTTYDHGKVKKLTKNADIDH